MTPLEVFAVVAVGTYLMRLTMLVLLGGRPLPHALVTPVGLIGPAAVGALTVSALVTHGHVADLPTTAAAAVAFVVVRRTKNITYGLLAAFPVVWLLNAIALL
ncbi:MAG TPA: AzlD domain-containing protein [Ilumatobacteraceae bacterium]|nr:AzlD domain-containing protein [Ilumatobacteraceae bacterium]